MQQPINKAFVLGAGLGTRLRPLTEQCPKPLVPICNKPLITYALDHLIAAGIKEFIINTHHRPERYRVYFSSGDYRGCPITLRHEETLLDTGGGIRNIADFADDEPLLVYNGDILTDLPVENLISSHLASGNAATLALRSSGGPLQVALDPATGTVTDIRDHFGSQGFPKFLFSGVYVINPQLIEAIPPGVVSIVDVWLNLIAAGQQTLGGVVLDDGQWWDVGNLEQYLAVHRFLFNHRYKFRYPLHAAPGQVADEASVATDVTLEGGTYIGTRATVQPGSKLSDCIVWENAKVAAQSKLHNVVILDGAIASGEVRGGIFTKSAFLPDASLPDFISDRAKLRFPQWQDKALDTVQLDKGGSDRSFFVVRSNTGDPVVALHYVGSQAEENLRYVAIANLLKEIGVRVPDILGHDIEQGLVWMQFLGNEDLWSRHHADRQAIMALYREVLEQAALLHARGHGSLDLLAGVPLHQEFDASLYLWEQGYFMDWCLRKIFQLDRDAVDTLRNDPGMQSIADELAALPRALVHRDFQSQNIMIHDGQPYFIDFQGARLGVPLYDLASLVYDPYVHLTADDRQALVDHYLQAAAAQNVPLPDDLPRALNLAAAQRLMQALGAYGQLGHNKGRRSFLRYVSPAMASLKPVVAKIPELQALDKTLASLVE